VSATPEPEALEVVLWERVRVVLPVIAAIVVGGLFTMPAPVTTWPTASIVVPMLIAVTLVEELASVAVNPE